MIKKRAALLGLMMSGLMLRSLSSYADENPDTLILSEESAPEGLSLDVSFGLDGLAREDRYFRVLARTANHEDADFSGTVNISGTQSDGEIYRYRYSISAGAGEETTLEVYLPLGVSPGECLVTLTGEDQTVRAAERFMPEIPDEGLLAGIFTDNPETLDYLDGTYLAAGDLSMMTEPLSAENAPASRMGYDVLDMLIFSDFDSSSLSYAQKNAVLSWAREGGTILFCGGENYLDTLGDLAGTFLEPPYEEAVTEAVDFGVEYSRQGASATTILLPCAELRLRGGQTLMQGDRFPLLSQAPLGNGRIIAAAFSLADIRDFCEAHPEFQQELFELAAGEDLLVRLAVPEVYGFSGRYEDIYPLVNTGNAGRLPDMPTYSMVLAIYLALIGPGLFGFLYRTGKRQLYLSIVGVTALLFTGIIYLMGAKTRFGGPFLTYAAVREISGGEFREETFLNVRSPENRPYSVNLRPEYEIRPLTDPLEYRGESEGDITGEETRVEIAYQEDRTGLSVWRPAAFAPRIFLLERSGGFGGEAGVEAEINLFETRVEGRVVNHTDETLERAVLLFKGKAVPVGTLEPQAEVDFSGNRVINWPLGDPGLAAGAFTGGTELEADVTNEEYLSSRSRSRLLAYYLDRISWENEPGARLVAFLPRQQQEFLAEENETVFTDGEVLVTLSAKASYSGDGMTYRSSLENQPVVTAGEYEASANAFPASNAAQSVTIEYSLGSGDIDRVYFEHLGGEFTGEGGVQEFSGRMWFYNYDTGRSDRMEAKDVFTAEELLPYLSPSNTLTVRYEPEKETGERQYLPMICAVGEE